jgi:hypothetical protein
MTDINSLPISSTDSNDMDDTVDNVLSALNGMTGCTELQDETQADEILNELSDDQSDEEYEGEYEDEDDIELIGGNVFGNQELIDQIKMPVIISIIAFLVNSDFIEKFILNVPFFGADTLNIFGILFKSVLIGAMFFLANKYMN